MGLPIVIGLSSAVIREVVDHTVVSVGPYIFQTDEARFNNSIASSRGNASPPHKLLKLLFPSHPASRCNLQVAGLACITLIAAPANILCNSYPSRAVSRLASTRRAPTIRGK